MREPCCGRWSHRLVVIWPMHVVALCWLVPADAWMHIVPLTAWLGFIGLRAFQQHFAVMHCYVPANIMGLGPACALA